MEFNELEERMNKTLSVLEENFQKLELVELIQQF